MATKVQERRKWTNFQFFEGFFFFSFLIMLTIRSVRLVFVVTVGCLEEVRNWNDGPTAAVLVLLPAD